MSSGRPPVLPRRRTQERLRQGRRQWDPQTWRLRTARPRADLPSGRRRRRRRPECEQATRGRPLLRSSRQQKVSRAGAGEAKLEPEATFKPQPKLELETKLQMEFKPQLETRLKAQQQTQTGNQTRTLNRM